MKNLFVVVALSSLFAITNATELVMQLNWDSNTPTNITVDGPATFRNRPSANTSAHPLSRPRPDNEQALVTPAFQNPIHPEDADSTGAGTSAYQIKSSGRYYLSNDLILPITVSGKAFILVNADNVTLNLNSKVIAPHVSANQTNLIGISNNNKGNLVIMNGTIQCTPASGTGRITTGLSLSSGAAYSVKVSDVVVNGATTTGLTGTSINDLSLERVACNNGSGTAASVGASLTTCKNIVLRNCEFSQNTTTTGNCKGLSLSGCQDGILENVSAVGNTTSSTSDGALAVGIGLASTCQNLLFRNCSASVNASSATQTTATTIHSVGFDINASPLNRFENCRANSNGGSSGNDNNSVGFHVIGASHNCEFVSCAASRNRSAWTAGTTVISNGFRVNGSGAAVHNLLFNKCSANYNQVTGGTSSDAAGFYCAGLANGVLLDCEATKNSSAGADAYGYYFTQSTATGNANNSLIGCVAKGNTASTATKNAVGFYSSAGTNNRYAKCVANSQSAGTGSTATEGNGGCGFKLASDVRAQVIECEAKGNATGAHANAFAYGVFLSGATNCSVKDCQIANNHTGGTGKTFGIYDASSSTTTFMLSNTVIGHGKCLSSNELNSSMQWKTTSGIPDNSQNYHYNHNGTSVSPQNMIHEVPKWNLASLSTTVTLWQNVSIY